MHLLGGTNSKLNDSNHASKFRHYFERRKKWKKDYGIALDVARVRRIWIVGTYRDPSRPAHKAASSS